MKMETKSEAPKVKPLFLVKPKTMSRADIRRAERLCGIVVVECEDPDSARFLYPPADAGLDKQALAALHLMRSVVSLGTNNYSTTFYKGDLMKWFLDALMEPPPKAVLPVKAKAS